MYIEGVHVVSILCSKIHYKLQTYYINYYYHAYTCHLLRVAHYQVLKCRSVRLVEVSVHGEVARGLRQRDRDTLQLRRDQNLAAQAARRCQFERLV